ncbi:MAG: POTRA domain-containing protein [Bacteroidota bacterium]|jgi:outer membrane protein insertion porin family
MNQGLGTTGFDIPRLICGEGYGEAVVHTHLASVKAVFPLTYCSLCGTLLVVFLSVANAQTSLMVRSISFEGNHAFSANQLASVLLIKKDGMFSEPVLTADLERILDLYKSQAYLHACVDSVWMKRDTMRQDVEVRIFLNEGKPSVVRQIELDGYRNFTIAELYTVMKLHEGDPFVPSLLEQDVQSILQLYERKGYPLAKVVIQNVSFTDSTEEMSARVQIHIDEGKELHITELRIEGNKTTKDYVITREARLQKNELFSSDLQEKIKQRLDHLQLFSSVSLPELYLTDANQGGMSVRVVEGNQNSFDGVLGYIPSTGSSGGGYLTGLVNVSLRNLFGTGRKLSARWYQENQSSQETELHYFEPWVASYPVNAQLGFFQRKQDSTFVRMQYDIAAELMLTDEFSVGVSFSQCGVYPTEGYGRSVMLESKTTSVGASVRYDSRDNPTTPASGILYSTEYQTGSKQTGIDGMVSTEVKSTTQRLVFDLSYYLSTFFRQVLATELHLRDFSSSTMDVSDLFRLGGASTLRGYREGQFLGSRIVWTNLEYRFLVAPRSFFYGFVDVGYIVQPSIAAMSMTASEQSKIGYGIGVRMDSSLGLIGVSFALGEGDTFGTSKIHIRLMNEF